MSASGSKGNSYHSVSSSSLLSLVAEVNKHASTLDKSDQKRPSRPEKKTPSTSWLKQNKGLAGRKARDEVQYQEPTAQERRDAKQAREILEKKAALYDKIKRGKSGGLSEDKISTLLVDFDRKQWEGQGESGSEEEDESSEEEEQGPQPLPGHDPLVEFTDEFGRTRMIPRSELPRGAPIPNQPPPVEVDETNVVYGDQHHFPVYQPDPDLLAKRAAAFAAAQAQPLVDHFDSSKEVRTKGAGFYQFSLDEEERAKQMAELKGAREETEKRRAEGGVGVEGAGLVEDDGAGEREWEREERRRIEAEEAAKEAREKERKRREEDEDPFEKLERRKREEEAAKAERRKKRLKIKK